ncbi:MAG: CDP-diacylglycerol--glycerol-3-phosphate 3-phosphatidyltransferase, partial [Pseudohongiellaceae bacterium]
MNWANLITYSRLVCIPIIIVLYLTEFPWHYLWAAGLFSLASLTDWADGYVARNFNQASEYGAFLDPVADKLLVVVVLVLLVANYSTVWFVLPVGAIIAREIIVSALREWMARRNQRDVVAVAFSGKLKTTVQMIAIIVLLASDP